VCAENAFQWKLGTPDGEVAAKASIYGALTLYLDFINMFQRMASRLDHLVGVAGLLFGSAFSPEPCCRSALAPDDHWGRGSWVA